LRLSLLLRRQRIFDGVSLSKASSEKDVSAVESATIWKWHFEIIRFVTYSDGDKDRGGWYIWLELARQGVVSLFDSMRIDPFRPKK
jgi:hypothetical protein